MILDTAGHVRIVILLYIHVSNMESRCMDIVPKTHLMKLQTIQNWLLEPSLKLDRLPAIETPHKDYNI